MLVFERYPEESFTLHTSDGVITVRVLGYKGYRVYLGIDAPKSVAILRDDAKQRHLGESLPQPASAGVPPSVVNTTAHGGT